MVIAISSAKAGNRSSKHCQVAILKVWLIERHVVESNQNCLKKQSTYNRNLSKALDTLSVLYNKVIVLIWSVCQITVLVCK